MSATASQHVRDSPFSPKVDEQARYSGQAVKTTSDPRNGASSQDFMTSTQILLDHMVATTDKEESCEEEIRWFLSKSMVRG